MISPAQDPYASRTDRSSAIISRQDPVVYGEGKYANALIFAVFVGLAWNTLRLLHKPEAMARRWWRWAATAPSTPWPRQHMRPAAPWA